VGQACRPVKHLPQTRSSDCQILVWSAFRKTENRIGTSLAIWQHLFIYFHDGVHQQDYSKNYMLVLMKVLLGHAW